MLERECERYPQARLRMLPLALSCMNTLEWPKGDDSEGVDVLVGPEVMCFDVMPMACFTNAWLSKHSLNVGLQVWVIDDAAKVALEMDDVDQIETNQGREQADVSFC